MEHEKNDQDQGKKLKQPVLDSLREQMSNRIDLCFVLINNIDGKVDTLIGSEPEPDIKGEKRKQPLSFIESYAMQVDFLKVVSERLERTLKRLNEHI